MTNSHQSISADIVDLLNTYAGTRSDGFAKLAVDAADEIERLRHDLDRHMQIATDILNDAQAERVWHRKDCPFCGSPDGQYSASFGNLQAAFFCKGCGINADQPPAAPVETEILDRLIRTANLLFQNAVSCAVQHHGLDIDLNGLPGWLADCKKVLDESNEIPPLSVQRSSADSDLAAKLKATHQQQLALWEAIAGGPEPRCRDCADFNGRCQGDGLPCDPQERALERIKRLRDVPQPLGVWQPIETAPKDGTPIEACNTRHPSHAPVIVRWDGDGLSDDVPEPHWCDAATRDGEALYYNQNYFDFWKPTTALPRPHLGGDK